MRDVPSLIIILHVSIAGAQHVWEGSEWAGSASRYRGIHASVSFCVVVLSLQEREASKRPHLLEKDPPTRRFDFLRVMWMLTDALLLHCRNNLTFKFSY